MQNISVLDKLVSCVRVDYENKTQMLLINFFIDSIQISSLQIHRGVLLTGVKSITMHYAQLKCWSLCQSIRTVYIPHRPTPLEFFETSPKAQPPRQIKKSSFSRDCSYHTNYLTTFYYKKAFQWHILVALASNNIITFLLIWYRRFRKQM